MNQYPFGQVFFQHEHDLVTVDNDCRMIRWDQYGDNKEQKDVNGAGNDIVSNLSARTIKLELASQSSDTTLRHVATVHQPLVKEEECANPITAILAILKCVQQATQLVLLLDMVQFCKAAQ